MWNRAMSSPAGVLGSVGKHILPSPAGPLSLKAVVELPVSLSRAKVLSIFY